MIRDHEVATVGILLINDDYGMSRLVISDECEFLYVVYWDGGYFLRLEEYVKQQFLKTSKIELVMFDGV